MDAYYRPIVRFGEAPPAQALRLAGGGCWFEHLAIHRRGQEQQMVHVSDAPEAVLARLTASRASVAGLDLSRPQVMGILNVTPDSFSDGGRFDDHAAALSHARLMQRQGAAIIDIGGESTRPGAAEVDTATEIQRTAPVIAAIRRESAVPVSIDTRKAAVAQAAAEAGASLVNDVAAMTFDPAMASTVAASGLPVCIMHSIGTPQTMQNDPVYDDVLLDIYDYLDRRIAAAEAAGIARAQIIIDPGIGFGKTLEHNLTILRFIAIYHGLGCAILLGASRKRFIGTIGGGDTPDDRLGGSVAVALHGARQGVQVLRVHDILATRQALDLEWAIGGADGP